MIHGSGNDRCEPIKGQEAIKKKILSFGYKDCRTKIDTVDSLESSLDNVVIQVVGQLSNDQQPMRRFFQTFVLCRRNTNHYFVKNDIFRFQDYEYPEEDDYFENELNTSQVSNIEPSAPLASESTSVNDLPINSLSVSNNNEAPVVATVAPTASTANNTVNTLDDVSALNTSNIIGSTLLNNSVNSAHIESSAVETNNVIERIASTLTSRNDVVHSVAIQQQQQPTPAAVSATPAGNSTINSNDLWGNHETVEEKTATIERHVEPVPDIFQNSLNPIHSASVQAENLRNTVSTYANMVLRSSKAHEQSAFGHVEPIQVKSTLASSVKNDFSSTGDAFAPLSSKDTYVETKQSNGNGGSTFFDSLNSQDNNGFGSHFGSSHKKEYSSSTDGQQLFVGHLDQSITEEQMSKFFSQYGPVLEASINRTNQRHGKALNFGFIIFEYADSVQKVLANKVSKSIWTFIQTFFYTFY